MLYCLRATCQTYGLISTTQNQIRNVNAIITGEEQAKETMKAYLANFGVPGAFINVGVARVADPPVHTGAGVGRGFGCASAPVLARVVVAEIHGSAIVTFNNCD